MISGQIVNHRLHFKRPSGTSRGILHNKDSWFILLSDDRQPGVIGIGECSIIRGLSEDDQPDYEDTLKRAIHQINQINFSKLDFNLGLTHYPSIKFGLETAFGDLLVGGNKQFFATPFSQGYAKIPINGLIWMGDPSFMIKQIDEKLAAGFRCLKMKIGAIHFEDEFRILTNIRKRYSAQTIEIRVDANGAFAPEEALNKLERLARLELHSIEQPIKPGQWERMGTLCRQTPLPIALDEELIGVHGKEQKEELLRTINPQFIILKPSLHGGFQGANEWIALASKQNIPWWATSALESNIGLNAIAQWTSTYDNPLPQGLGTGSLYTNNVAAPLKVKEGFIYLDKQGHWDLWEIYHKAFRQLQLNGRMVDLDHPGHLLNEEEIGVVQFLQSWLTSSPIHAIKTSGSTGIPKNIQLTKSDMVSSALKTGAYFELKANQKALLALPLHYIAGQMMVIRALVLQLDLRTIPVSSNPLVDLEQQIDFAALTPMQLNQNLEGLSRIKTLIIGGAPITQSLRIQLQMQATACFETYGMTETITHIAVRKLNGQSASEYFHALDGISLSTDQEDALMIRAAHLSAKTFMTNDIVDLISTTQFKWLGRRDFVINSGGIKVFPEIIEQKLQPLIDRPFFIAGLPDERLGQKVTLVIEGDIPISASIIHTIPSLVTAYEKPRAIKYLKAFCYTKNGKLDRKSSLNKLLA